MRYIVECRQHKHDHQSYDTSKSRSLPANKYTHNFKGFKTDPRGTPQIILANHVKTSSICDTARLRNSETAILIYC